MTDPLNIILDDFSIWLLGHRIELHCLYIPQGLFMRKYFVTLKYRWIWILFIFERKSTFNITVNGFFCFRGLLKYSVCLMMFRIYLVMACLKSKIHVSTCAYLSHEQELCKSMEAHSLTGQLCKAPDNM